MPILFDFIEDRLCLVGGQDSCFTSAALDRDGPNATTATSRLAVDVHHLRKVDVVLLGGATALAFFLNNAGFRKYPSRATARAGHTAATTCVAVSGNSFVGRLSSFQGLLPAFCHFQCPDSLLDAQLVAHHDVHLLHVRVLHLGKLLLRNTMLFEGLDGCTTYCCHPKEILHLLDVCRRHSLLSRSWHGGETSQINWDRIRSTYWAVTAAEPRRAKSDNLIIFFGFEDTAEVKLTQNCWNMLHKKKIRYGLKSMAWAKSVSKWQLHIATCLQHLHKDHSKRFAPSTSSSHRFCSLSWLQYGPSMGQMYHWSFKNPKLHEITWHNGSNSLLAFFSKISRTAHFLLSSLVGFTHKLLNGENVPNKLLHKIRADALSVFLGGEASNEGMPWTARCGQFRWISQWIPWIWVAIPWTPGRLAGSKVNFSDILMKTLQPGYQGFFSSS